MATCVSHCSLYPDSSITKLSLWSHFNSTYSGTYYLNPTDPLYNHIGTLFIKEVSLLPSPVDGILLSVTALKNYLARLRYIWGPHRVFVRTPRWSQESLPFLRLQSSGDLWYSLAFLGSHKELVGFVFMTWFFPFLRTAGAYFPIFSSPFPSPSVPSPPDLPTHLFPTWPWITLLLYLQYTTEFGTNHFYNIDPWNEMTPAEGYDSLTLFLTLPVCHHI